ncbi:hypothetical protein FGB62_112g23 [Gracilaria domingensis]|nr:hypothetical protein FGB62_112g23 [Gracilaria domingensis]
MEPSSKDRQTDSASYRHLFTFGEETRSSPFSTNAEQRTSRQFTFLGSGVDLFQASKSSNEDGAEQLEHHEQDHHMSKVPQPRAEASEELQLSFPDNIVENEHEDHDGVQERKGFHAPVNIEGRSTEGNEYVGYMFEEGQEQSYGEEPAFQLPPDIFSRPEALKDIACQFVRSSGLEQLGEEWERVDGIRDQMRRDFKIRRQKDIGNIKSRSTNVDVA